MAFFKFRKGGDDSAAAPSQPESVEVLRRRARHRLIGAAVLVLLGIVGFPLLFDTQPRPVAVDIPIEIPDRNKARPLPQVQPGPKPQAGVTGTEATAAAKPASAPAARAVAAGTVNAPAEAAPSQLKAEPKAQPAAEAPKAVAAASKPAAVASRPAVAKAPPAQDAERAKALLDGQASAPRPASTDESGVAGRLVVQVGAFSDDAKAREARLKVEKAGLKTYTQVAETKDGKRIRVRVGPFANRAEAEKAASRIKELDLPAAILTL